MKKILKTLAIIFVPSLALAQTPTENYIKNTTYRIETTTGSVSNSDKNESTIYFDGLGRPMQAISNRAGGNGEDIITHIGYDEYGRQDKDYLPYTSSANIGTFRTNALSANNIYYDATKYDADFPSVSVNDINAYSQRELEASPLNRVLKQAAPGYDWRLGGGNEIGFEYGTNTATEVRYYEVSLDKTTNNSVITYIPTLVLDTSVNNNYGYYQANSLYKIITKDENHDGTSTKNHTTEEFKDKQGRVVLKRTYADTDLNDDGDTSDIGETEVSHDTYYVYDKFGNLSYVMPPKAEAHIDKPDNSFPVSNSEVSLLCYQYTYDDRNRLVEKKIPGKEGEYFVYNELDQIIMTQDYNTSKSSNWLFTKYDAFGRVAYTGLIKGTSSSEVGFYREYYQHQANLANSNYVVKLSNNPITLDGTTIYYSDEAYPTNLINYSQPVKILTINYYDDYVFDIGSGVSEITYGLTPVENAKGLPTGSKVKVLNISSTKWITNINYYDAKSRPILVYSFNDYLETTDKIKSKLDFVGAVEESTTTHTKNGQSTITTFDYFIYDDVGRLVTQNQKINSLAEETIVQNSYDDLGKLISKGVGGKSTQDRLQNVDYSYNIRGWLKQINNPAAMGDDLFGFKIDYNEGITALYNGNISLTQWKTNNTDSSLKTYAYLYDALNRITSATDNLDRYSLSDVSYDKNGNIKKLKRKGHIVENPVSTNSSHFGIMDDLIYTYQSNSNKLIKVEDVAAIDGFGFIDDAVNQVADTSIDYTYTPNGDLTSDGNKKLGMTTYDYSTYNHLGLTSLVFSSTSSDIIQYIYDANGVKLKKIVNTGSTTTYAGNYVYQTPYGGSEALKFFNHPEGYVDVNAGVYKYVYQYKDHLGNIRLSYSDSDNSGTVTGENNFITVWEDGFESATGWDGTGASWGHALDAFDTTVKHSGNYSGRIDVHGNGSGYGSRSVHSLDWVPINNSVNTEYRISQWFFMEDIPQWSRARIELMLKEEGETAYTTSYEYDFLYEKGKWVFAEKTILVPPNIKYLNFRITYDYSNTTSGSIWYDDLKIERVEPTNNSEIVEENNYYPFGLEHKGYNKDNILSTNIGQQFTFNGQQFDKSLGLNISEMTFRQYDPAIGRFNVIDPLAENYHNWTPYRFGFNNPIVWSDPSGLIERSVLNDIYRRSNSGDKWYNDGTGFYTDSGGYVGYTSDDNSFNRSSGEATNLPAIEITQGDDMSYQLGAWKTQSAILGTQWYNHQRQFISQKRLSLSEKWSNSDNMFASMSYGILNDAFQVVQSVDADLIPGRTNPLTGSHTNINIDGSANYKPADGFVNTLSFAIPFARGTKAVSAVLPKGLGYLQKFNAAQFSQRFKGNLSRLAPKYRGVLNRYLNKGINSYNNQVSNGLITLKALWVAPDEE